MLDREITMIWDERVGGFTSFQTYDPDTGLSLNNRFFSFKMGIIWEHHIDEVARNRFYSNNNDSIVRVVFNDEPSAVKNFKTLGYEGTGNWGATISTDQQSTIIDSTAVPPTRTDSGKVNTDTFDRELNQLTFNEFVNREGKNYGYIRGEGQDETDLSFESIAVQGLGVGTRVGSTLDSLDLIEIPSELYQGDSLYFFQDMGEDPLDPPSRVYGTILNLLGTVVSVDRSTNRITYLFNPAGGATEPTTGDFFLFNKDNVVETSGVIGFFGIVEFRSSDTSMVELFSINSEAVLSSN